MNNNRGNNRRRSRGNNRPQGGNQQQLNRIDSRARGNAPQLLEKYRKLAQDAHLNGDRVQAEYYLQFADHYFRVIADARLRQEEQRQRQGGSGFGQDRWQDSEGEDDSLEFGGENEFGGYDRAPSYQQQPRRDERDAPRENGRDHAREDRGERGPREERQRDDRPRDDRQREDRPREDRPREDRQREDRAPRERRPVEAAPIPGEGLRADEGEPITEATENPFMRDARPSRGLRPRTERRPRRGAEDEAAPAALDPSSLPPAFGARVIEEEPAAVTDPAPAADAAPAPKKRGRPRKNPLPEAAEG